MKKVKAFILILCLIIAAAYLIKSPQQSAAFIRTNGSPYDITMKQDLLSLMMAYPEHISNVEQSEGRVYIVMQSGKKILYDDKKTKSIETKIAYPDLQDMLEQAYPIAPIEKLMDKNYDPGRARVYSLLNEVYGASQKQIENNLSNAKVGYGTFQFNGNNQAAEALEKAMKELAVLAEKRRDIRACIYPCNGTYNYRVIAGTNRLSPHSYGIAIDLARDKRDYWQWASREEGQKRLSSYPNEIAALFEKHNFIWGGKWGHFDILHFEYRPEIIIKARYFGSTQDFQQVWYTGVPLGDEYIKSCIKKIDEAIK
jgi:hypothetical protein